MLHYYSIKFYFININRKDDLGKLQIVKQGIIKIDLNDDILHYKEGLLSE